MENQDTGIGRRTLLSITAGGIGTALLPSSVAGQPGRGRGRGRRGPPKHAAVPPWAAARNGELELEVTKAEWESTDPTELEGIPEDAEPLPYEAVQEALELLNEDVRSGQVRFENADEKRGPSVPEAAGRRENR